MKKTLLCDLNQLLLLRLKMVLMAPLMRSNDVNLFSGMNILPFNLPNKRKKKILCVALWKKSCKV